jgi:trigger factor
VWQQVEQDLKTNNRTFADEGTTEQEARADYRRIAERRVRLGLVLAQIGEKTDIKVSDDEVTQALVERVRQFPGQEQQVWDFYRKNPQALAEIRAPLFEEKVVDQILSQVKVVDEPVSKEVLFLDEDAEAPAEAAAEAPAEKPAKKGGKKAAKSE